MKKGKENGSKRINGFSLSAAVSAGIGSALLMLLRFCDQAGGLSALMVVAAVTALLYSIRHAGSRKTLIWTAGCLVLAYAVRLYGYTAVPAVDLVGGALIGLIEFGLFWSERLLKKFENRFWYSLIDPTVYLLFMLLTEVFKTNMPYRLDAYVSSLQVLCQITSVFGIYILDFLIVWTASVLVFVWDHKAERPCIPAGILYAAVLCGIFCFGVIHLNSMNAAESAKDDTVRVAYTTGPYIGRFGSDYAVLSLEEYQEALFDAAEQAAENGAEILMFSEEAFSVKDTEEDQLLEAAEKLADEKDLHILLPYEVEDTDQSEDGKGINKMCWISDEGQILYDYTKHCLVPLVETSDYVRGEKKMESFDIRVHDRTLKVAAAICFDGDFDFFVSHMGKNVDLLLLPTWDWELIAGEHLNVMRLRAIANETTVVRSVYDGWSAVIDSAGNIRACDNTNDIGYEQVLYYDVPF